MTQQEKEQLILQTIQGMRYSEWRLIVHAVEREFEKAANRIEFTQNAAEGAMNLIELER